MSLTISPVGAHHFSTTIMKKHYGHIVEYNVRKNGFSISDLARLLSINRRSLYNWFNREDIKPEMIFRIGCVIKHDFSKDFPELFDSEEFEIMNMPKQIYVHDVDSEDDIWKDKYIRLLEEYNQMFLGRREVSVA